MRLSEFWSQCLALLQSELSEQQFSRDIAPITVGEQDGAWVLFAKNQFAANLLRTQYANKIHEAAALIAPDAPELRFQIGVGEQVAIAVVPTDTPTDLPTDTASPADNAEGSLKTSAASATPAEAARNKNKSAQDIIAERMSNLRPAKKTNETQPESQTTAAKPSAIAAEQAREAAEQRLNQTNLSPDYTFETLVEGKGNQLAANVAKSIAEKPGDSMYNPFFVYGSTGLGKTHLVQAIGNELLRLNPKAKVRYMHSDEYLKTFMATVRNKTWDTFKQQYLHYNLLIIDDIQFISGKDRTMEEFFFLFEHFHSRDQQIILTCDQLPSSLEDMDKRLVSRFSWGMTIRLEPPELEMRVDILERKAQAAGIMLEEDAATFIAQNVKQNVRELEGALNRVIARCRFSKASTIDIDLATDALQDIVASNYKPITVEAITKELTNLSLPAIGDAFGGRDHTTVMHAIKTIAKLRQDEPELKQDYEKLLIVIQH